jgi:hypothetical protein
MLLTALLTASLLATAPAPSCVAPTHTGTFRFTALTKDSTNAKIGMIVLENIEGCLEATMLTDDAGPAVIDHLAFADSVLTGNVRVAHGTAKVTFRFTTVGLSGSIVDGKKEWTVAARRTSGSNLDVAVVKYVSSLLSLESHVQHPPRVNRESRHAPGRIAPEAQRAESAA